jgi:hypothetical protein
LVVAHEGRHYQSVISVEVQDIVERHGVAIEKGVPSLKQVTPLLCHLADESLRVFTKGLDARFEPGKRV